MADRARRRHRPIPGMPTPTTSKAPTGMPTSAASTSSAATVDSKTRVAVAARRWPAGLGRRRRPARRPPRRGSSCRRCRRPAASRRRLRSRGPRSGSDWPDAGSKRWSWRRCRRSAWRCHPASMRLRGERRATKRASPRRRTSRTSSIDGVGRAARRRGPPRGRPRSSITRSAERRVVEGDVARSPRDGCRPRPRRPTQPGSPRRGGDDDRRAAAGARRRPRRRAALVAARPGAVEVHRRRADERGDEQVGRPLVEVAGRVALLDPAAVEHGDPVDPSSSPRPGRA